MVDESLKPYLTYSAAAHAGLAALAFLVVRASPSARPDQVYRIDFIGNTGAIINRDLDAAYGPKRRLAPAGSSRTPPPQTNPDAFSRKSRKPLPRPSFLDANPRPAEPEKPEAAAPAAAAPAPAGDRPAGTAAADGAAAGAAVDTDMPNFPYPWYITQVRTSLWTQWSRHMPPAGGETLVMFSILRNGSVTDLRVESSSGDGVFDLAALSAVQESAPFPPLPRGFAEQFLKVHVRFTAQ